MAKDDITLHLPEDSQTVNSIYDASKKQGDAEPKRGYLGASIIGHPCERYLWFYFRGCFHEDFPGRMYRLFDSGDCAEIRFVQDLRKIGCTVHDIDSSGKQFAVSAFGGHFSGHMDGCALGVPEAPKTWHVLEFKTHSVKSFAKLKKESVQKAKPMHFAQMQAYMGLAKMTRSLYLAVNKDTDELYSERIRFDSEFFDSLMEKAERIIFSDSFPYRIADRPDWYECSYCPAKVICFGGAKKVLPVLYASCRQCCHASPVLGGEASWKCELHDRRLSESDQDKACRNHMALPGILAGCEFTESGKYNDQPWVKVKCKAGEFYYGSDEHCFSSEELMKLSHEDVCNPLLQDAKNLFCAKLETDGIAIEKRYEDAELLWTGNTRGLSEAYRGLFHPEMREEKIIAKDDIFDSKSVEFLNGVAVIHYEDGRQNNCEIRKGKS